MKDKAIMVYTCAKGKVHRSPSNIAVGHHRKGKVSELTCELCLDTKRYGGIHMDVMTEFNKMDEIKKGVVHLLLENFALKKRLDELGELEHLCQDCTYNLFSTPKGRRCCTCACCTDKSKWELRSVII